MHHGQIEFTAYTCDINCDSFDTVCTIERTIHHQFKLLLEGQPVRFI